MTDRSGSQEVFYDSLGRVVKTIRTIGNQSFPIERSYDAADRVISLTYPDGTLVTSTYGAGGDLERLVAGTSPVVEQVAYSASRQLTRIVYGNGTATDYTYDPLTLRLTTLTTRGPTGTIQELQYGFDRVGNVTDIRDLMASSTQTFLYDALNRLLRAQGPYGTLNYAYDPLGNLTHKEGIDFTYEPQRPHAIATASNGTLFSYDANGNLTGKSRGAVRQTWTYDADNRLVRAEQYETAPTTVALPFRSGRNHFALRA